MKAKERLENIKGILSFLGITTEDRFNIRYNKKIYKGLFIPSINRTIIVDHSIVRSKDKNKIPKSPVISVKDESDFFVKLWILLKLNQIQETPKDGFKRRLAKQLNRKGIPYRYYGCAFFLPENYTIMLKDCYERSPKIGEVQLDLREFSKLQTKKLFNKLNRQFFNDFKSPI